jgi:hypothetical protein
MLVLKREGMLVLFILRQQPLNHQAGCLKKPRCAGLFERRSPTLLSPAQTGCNRIVLKGKVAEERVTTLV